MAATEDPDRRAEEARASLLARVEELGHRLQDAKEKLDISAHIAAHPRAAVGIAFALGALLGIPGKRSKPPALPTEAAEARAGLVGAAVATIGALVFQLAKSIAFHQLSEQARDWWDRRRTEAEVEASRTRSAEAFLEH